MAASEHHHRRERKCLIKPQGVHRRQISFVYFVTVSDILPHVELQYSMAPSAADAYALIFI